MGIEENRPYCYDEQGQRIADYTEIKVQLEEEEKARQRAEEQAEAEVVARQAEAEARQKAEDELREMAAELERLRNELASGEK